MPQTENSIEQSFVRWCKKHKIKTFKLALNPGRGWPDRAVLFPENRTCWIEFKTPGGRLSPSQVHVIAEMQTQGHDVFTVRSCDEAKQALAKFAKKYGTALVPEDSTEASD